MADTTNISWCDHTHNHWIGCTKVSPACDGCYAEAMMDKRYHRVQWGAPGQGNGTRALTAEANRRRPLAWDRAALADGSRPFVFCSSLADVFDNQVPVEWRAELFDLIRKTPRLVWLLLTKRPQNIVRMCEEAGGMPANVALGTTCEDQTRYNLNAKHLSYAKSLLRPLFTFISAEPLLGPIDLYLTPKGALDPDWVITGGETDQGGHEARPSHPQWVRDIRDQCRAAGVAYHHKQNGEWLAVSQMTEKQVDACYQPRPRRDPNATRVCKVEETVLELDGTTHGLRDVTAFRGHGAMQMFKVGKGKSGRLLDGVEHNAFPAVRAAYTFSVVKANIDTLPQAPGYAFTPLGRHAR